VKNYSKYQNIRLSHTRYQDLLIHVYKKNVRTTRIGEVRIPFKNLIRLFQPSNCSWGLQTYESEFDIMECTNSKSTTCKIVGTMSLKLLMQMEMYPPLYDYTTKNVDTTSTPNYVKLFDLLVQKLVSSNDRKAKRQGLLSYNQSWIIEEYCHQHGISEVYKRLAFMREMVQRTDLLLQCIEEFKQSLDYVITSIKTKQIIPTRYETKLLNDIKDDLVQKIEAVVSKFITVLEGGRRKVLKILIELLQFLRTRDQFESDAMSKKEFKECLKKLIQSAIEEDYEIMKKEQIDSLRDTNSNAISAAALIKIVQILKVKVDDILFYSSAIPEYINFPGFALHLYYDKFDTDFEVVNKSSNGFTGYEMLVFCKKLKEYHEEIDSTFEPEELQEEKVRLLDMQAISKGYEEKYVHELHQRLIGHMQRAIALDRWKRTNNEVLYSDSLIDFFTSANQIVTFVNELEFLSQSLLERFAVVIGQCVVEYAKALERLCLKEIMTDDTANNNNKDKSVEQKTTFFNIKALTSATSKSSSDSKHHGVTITPEFIIKFNDIEASRAQFKQIIESLKTTKLALIAQAKLEDVEDSEEDSILADSETINEDESSDSDSDDESEEDESEKEDSITEELKKTLYELDVISDDLISLILSQFDPHIKLGISNAMQQVKKIVKKSDPLSDDKIIKEYGSQVNKTFHQFFFADILTPNLEVLTDNIYDEAFKKILARTFSNILRYCVELLIPSATFGSDITEPLDHAQIILLKKLIKFCSDYFYGGGEGISKTTLTREQRFIDRIFKLMSMDTDRLIEIYMKFTGKNAPQSSVKGYHILAVISSRSKVDKVAANFLKQNQQPALQLFLVHEFALTEDAEKTPIISSHSAMNDKLKKGTCFLLPNYILWSPSTAFRKNVDPQFTKNRTAVDIYSGKFKIFLKDIKSMKPMNPFMSKGIKFYLQSSKNTMKIHMDNRTIRDTLMNAIVSEAKRQQNNITILEARSQGISASIPLRTKKKNGRVGGPTRVLTMPEEALSTINPAMVSSKDIAKVLQSRFGISGANLVERYACSCTVSDTNETTGTLYLFDTCFCFDSLGNYTIDDTDLISSWYRVVTISKNDSEQEIRMSLQDGRVVTFSGFLSDFPDVVSCVTKLKQEYDKDNKQLAMKTSDPKTYYLARFNLKNDNLKMTCSCTVPGKALFTEPGMLFIGEKNICLERDNNAFNVLIISIADIKGMTAKNWRLGGRICLEIQYGGANNKQVQKFIIKNGIQEIMAEIKKRMN
jgi:DNA-binding Xre family transcriptional regulator